MSDEKNLGANAAEVDTARSASASDAATARHTELPWRYAKDEPAGCRVEISNDAGVLIAEVLNFDDFPCLDQHDDVEQKCIAIDAEAQANAEFIVRACNSHDELLTALRWMVKQEVETCASGDCGNYDCELMPSMIAARAAIAKAEGR